MNFWKGLLKQIAKCSVCRRTGGKGRFRREGKQNDELELCDDAPSFRQMLGPPSLADALAVERRAGKPSSTMEEKRILAGMPAA